MLSRLMTRREQLVIALGAGAVILGSVTFFIMRQPAEPRAELHVQEPVTVPRASEENPTPGSEADSIASSDKSKNEVVVSLTGAVARPGVYTLESGSRIQDLLLAAGGATVRADTSDINLACKLIDGTTLIVPGDSSRSDGDGADQIAEADLSRPNNLAAYTISGWEAGSARNASAGGTSGGLININRATQGELESLPGIGPKYAQEIIRYRTASPFANTQELLNVSGIGPKRFEAMRELVTTH